MPPGFPCPSSTLPRSRLSRPVLMSTPFQLVLAGFFDSGFFGDSHHVYRNPLWYLSVLCDLERLLPSCDLLLLPGDRLSLSIRD